MDTCGYVDIDSEALVAFGLEDLPGLWLNAEA